MPVSGEALRVACGATLHKERAQSVVQPHHARHPLHGAAAPPLRRLVDGTLGLPGSDDDSDGRQEKRVKAGLVAGFLLR